MQTVKVDVTDVLSTVWPAIAGCQTLAEVLDIRAAEHGDRELIICEGETSTYQEMSDRSAKIAGGLTAFGIQSGDRVAVLVENSLAVIELYFACARLGAIIVPLNVYLRGQFLQHQIEDSGAAAVIVDVPGLAAFRALPPVTSVREVFVVGSSELDGSERLYAELAQAGPMVAASRVERHDTAAIVYTSGTTGMPKGCIVPHGQFVALAESFIAARHYRPHDRVITPSPMFHMGFAGGMFAPAIACGATVISVRQFSASTFWRTANDHRATVIFGAGAVGMLLLAQPADDVTPAPPSLRHALLTPMNVDAQLDFENRFGVPVNCSSYGQTECTCISISTLGEDIDRSSAGRPLDTLEVRVVDGDDVPVPAGEVGEIVVRPRRPDVMFRGYWDAPDATIEAWRNLWHHTGDVGRLSGAGELYIVDRKTDSMRHRGENVSSLQIEGAIMRHDAIASVAAHSVPSDLGEDEIKVCIVLVTGTSVDRAELFDFFKQSLPYFAVPRFVEIMDQLPVNAIGRVLKQDLRNRGVTAQTWDFQALGLTVSRSERRGAV